MSEGPFICDDCSKEFPKPQGLALHRTRIHSNGAQPKPQTRKRSRVIEFPERDELRLRYASALLDYIEANGKADAEMLDRLEALLA